MQPILADISRFVEKQLRWIVTSSSVLPQDTNTTSDDDFEDLWRNGGGGGGSVRRTSSILQTGSRNRSISSVKDSRDDDENSTLHSASSPPGGARHPLAASKKLKSSTKKDPYTISMPGPTTTKARFLAMLYCAVFDGDCAAARRMTNFLHRRCPEELAAFVDPTEVVPFAAYPFTIVHYAVASNNPEMVELVLFFEGDLTKLTRLFSVRGPSAAPYFVTPLHIAVGLESFDVVRTLLAAGAQAQSLRGPPSHRISALQDALQQLGDQLAMSAGGVGGGDDSFFTGGAGGGLRPLYSSRDGVSSPARRPRDLPAHMPPWNVWVEHGEEERSKISRGAWRADTGSFFRSRTPSPSGMDGGQRNRALHTSDSSVGSGSPAGGADGNDNARRGSFSAVSPPLSRGAGGGGGAAVVVVDPSVPLNDRPLFQIAVLLLHQGAEMIFNKSGLGYEGAKRLQHATVLAQKELHRRLQNHEDTGLALVIGQAAEAEQQLRLLEESQRQLQIRRHDNGESDDNFDEEDRKGYDDDDADEFDDDAHKNRKRGGGDGSDCSSETPDKAPATVMVAPSSRRSHTLQRGTPSTIARLMTSVTPTHELYISRVIASRVRDHHQNRLESLDLRRASTSMEERRRHRTLPSLNHHHYHSAGGGGGGGDDRGGTQSQPPQIAVRIPPIGSAVWVLPSSRYHPNPTSRRRTSEMLLSGTRATKLLTAASRELLDDASLCNTIVKETNDLLRLISIGGDPEAPTTAIIAAPAPRCTPAHDHQPLGEGHPSSRHAHHHSLPNSNNTGGDCTSNHNHHDDVAVDLEGGFSLAVPSLIIPHSTSINNDVAGSGVMENSNSQWGYQVGGTAAVGEDDELQRGLSRTRSFVRVTETSRMFSSRSGGAVFSQSMKVGEPDTVVGCVACIVSLPDHRANGIESSLLATTIPPGTSPLVSRRHGGRSVRAYSVERRKSDCIVYNLQSAAQHHHAGVVGRRLFAGLIVEPIYNTNSTGGSGSGREQLPAAAVTIPSTSDNKGLLIPTAVARARVREGEQDQLLHLGATATGSVGSGGGGGGGVGSGATTPPNQSFSAQQHQPQILSEEEETYRQYVMASSSIADGVGRTLPFCSLFVPIEDLVVVDHAAAAQVAEHRLRRSLNILGTAIVTARKEMENGVVPAANTTTTYASFPGIPAHYARKQQQQQLADTMLGASSRNSHERVSGMHKWLKERRIEQAAKSKELSALRHRRF